MKHLNWMHADDATDQAKESACRAEFGDRTPQRVWYYSPLFNEEALGGMLAALLPVFWDAGVKSRVVPNMDVKVEYVSALPGVPILRVSLPNRLLGSFRIGDITFVLYKAMADGRMIDFGERWGGLARGQTGGSATVVGNLGNVMAGGDVPVPAALLRAAEKQAVAEPPKPPVVRTPDIPRRPPSDGSAYDVPRASVPVSDHEPPPSVPEPPRLVPRIRRGSGWEVFGGKPEEKSSPPAPPPVARSATPLPVQPAQPDPADDPIPEDSSDRMFVVLLAAMVVVACAAGAVYLLW